MGLDVQIVFDCHDAEVMMAFWAVALDYIPQPPPEGFDSWPAFLEAQGFPALEEGSIGAVVDPAGTGPRVLFERVPEGKTVKNRVHLDIRTRVAGGDQASIDAKVAQLLDAGGTVRNRQVIQGRPLVGMADPEGNEFDVT